MLHAPSDFSSHIRRQPLRARPRPRDYFLNPARLSLLNTSLVAVARRPQAAGSDRRSLRAWPLEERPPRGLAVGNGPPAGYACLPLVLLACPPLEALPIRKAEHGPAFRSAKRERYSSNKASVTGPLSGARWTLLTRPPPRGEAACSVADVEGASTFSHLGFAPPPMQPNALPHSVPAPSRYFGELVARMCVARMEHRATEHERSRKGCRRLAVSRSCVGKRKAQSCRCRGDVVLVTTSRCVRGFKAVPRRPFG
jgi:hypothetical protein